MTQPRTAGLRGKGFPSHTANSEARDKEIGEEETCIVQQNARLKYYLFDKYFAFIRKYRSRHEEAEKREFGQSIFE